MKRNLLITILIFALIAAFASFCFAEVKNPDTIILATIGGPESMDPSYSYDTASGEVICNVYDNLIAYKGESVAE